MLLKQQTSLLECRIWLILQLKEASDDPANVADVVPVLLLIELELILEQVVLLLENGDTS